MSRQDAGAATMRRGTEGWFKKRAVEQTVVDKGSGDKRQVRAVVYRARYRNEGAKSTLATLTGRSMLSAGWMRSLRQSSPVSRSTRRRARITFEALSAVCRAPGVGAHDAGPEPPGPAKGDVWRCPDGEPACPPTSSPWIASMDADGFAPTTVVTRMFTWARGPEGPVRDRVIVVDPSAGVRLPRRRRREHAMEIPTADRSLASTRRRSRGCGPT